MSSAMSGSSNDSVRFYNCSHNEFCSGEASHYCNGSTLVSCEYCNAAGAVAYTIIMTILGLAILLGNCLIIYVSIQRHRNNTFQKVDAVKLSLAVIDFVTGVQIFAVVLPNFSRMMRTLVNENYSPSSIFCGYVMFFTFASSLLHLILLGIQRLHAIGWPHHYTYQPIKHVYRNIAIVHLFCAVIATFPLWFPGHFFYCSVSHLCFWCGRVKSTYIALYLLIFLAFGLMTCLSVVVAILARVRIGRSSQRLGSNSATIRNTKQQITVFKTVALMQVGFTVSLAPTIVYAIMLEQRLVSCDIRDVITTVCFSFLFTNSLWNVFIYSSRDDKFRASVIDLYKSLKVSCSKYCCTCCRDEGEDRFVAVYRGETQNNRRESTHATVITTTTSNFS